MSQMFFNNILLDSKTVMASIKKQKKIVPFTPAVSAQVVVLSKEVQL